MFSLVADNLGRAGDGALRNAALLVLAVLVLALASGLGAAPVGASVSSRGPVSLDQVSVLGRIHDRVGEPIAFGAARYYGAPPQLTRREHIVAMASTPDGRGYWLVADHGTVYAFGDARNRGSAKARSLVVAIVATSDGNGYWLALSDGVVDAFGDAHSYGSAFGHHPRVYIVAMVATPDDKGYWLAAANGHVYAFGDAHHHWSARTNSPVVAMADTSNGKGYWLACSDGAVFHFGNAVYRGSELGRHPAGSIIGIAASPGDIGYWLFDSDGDVYRFRAPDYGQALHGSSLNSPILSDAAVPDSRGYWLLPTAGLPPPGPGFVAGKVTAIGDSVMLDAAPCLAADIPGIDIEAKVSRQWDDGESLAAQLKSEDHLGAVVIVDLGTNGPVTSAMFSSMMRILSGASRVVFVTVHLPPSYSWWRSVNETLERGVPRYAIDRLADFNKLADEHPQWFGPDGVHMPIGGPGAQAMARLITTDI